jgi:phasin family protein
MTAIPEQWTAMGKTQVDNALRIAEIVSRGARKLAELNFKVAETAFAEGIKNIKSLSEIKDVAEISTWATGIMQPGLEKASAYGKHLYQTATTTSAELGAVFEEQVSEFTRQVVIALDAATRTAPAGSEAAIAAVKSVIGVANGVYDTITKASKQLAAMTEVNLAQAAPHTPRKRAA